MQRECRVRRREFLVLAGGFLSLAGSAKHGVAAEAGSATAKRDPAKLRRLLSEMDAQASRYWSVPRKESQCYS